MRGKREIRRIARAAAWTMLECYADDEESDLYATPNGEGDWTAEELDEFRAEIVRVVRRISR